MQNKIVLASKSKIRKEILNKNNILCDIEPSKIDEDIIKESLIKEKASPELISKNLAELKANKISTMKPDRIVLGADSVIDLEGTLISKPENREDAMKILKKLNGKQYSFWIYCGNQVAYCIIVIKRIVVFVNVLINGKCLVKLIGLKTFRFITVLKFIKVICDLGFIDVVCLLD